MPRRSVDYIVVGAGSAGCVLANRLSESASVLLLEAGEPDRNSKIRIPAAFGDLFKSDVDWSYYTEPQSNLENRRLFWPRGKTLGGSSSINAQIYIRGHPADYDRWADVGNDGWSYEDVLPYFKRAEANQRLDDDYHGTDGPRQVTDLQSPNPLSEAFVDAAVEAGYPRNVDFNGAEQAGVGFYQVTQKDGQRHSAADAYLKPALDRSILDARTGAEVVDIRFDGTRAVGVDYLHEGELKQADAHSEVIVAGGAVNSPKLLMQSGIGPADHLREHGIDVIADLPGVGENLQDHLFLPVVYEDTKGVSFNEAENLRNALTYFLRKQGPFTSNIAEAGGFVRTDAERRAPDLQFHMGPAYFVDHGFESADGHYFGVGPTLIRPESTGRIRLHSRHASAPPAIEPNYLDADADLEVLVEGIRRVREIVDHEPLADYAGAEIYPGRGATSDAELADHVRRRAQTLYHPVGTCRMGDDEMAVVDDRLRVHGIDDLRVVDASVMPTVPGGNTDAPTTMVAEKAVDLIREDRENSVT